MSATAGVRVEFDAGVAVVTIDRPEVRNAIGFATVDELGAALDTVEAAGAAVLVLRGGAELVDGGEPDRVADLGPIDGDHRDAGVDLDPDPGCGHRRRIPLS